MLPTYGIAIFNALNNGYKVDTERGIIYGLKGAPLTIKLQGKQRYPSVSLVVVNMPSRYYVVPAHKVVAAALWGEAAFAKGTHIRHGANGVLDISAANLKLGTASENEADKPKYVKSMVARAARAAQPRHGHNSKIDLNTANEIRVEYLELKRLFPRKMPSGSVIQIAAKYKISKTNIYDIIKGNIWNA